MGFRRNDWMLIEAAGMLGIAVVLSGCGNALFAVQASRASRNLEHAREMGAETLAPYEYYYAAEHLKKARMEASEADYGDARILAKESNDYALKAIRIVEGAGQ